MVGDRGRDPQHGALSLELAGHFTGMGFDPARLFDDEVDDLTAARQRG